MYSSVRMMLAGFFVLVLIKPMEAIRNVYCVPS